MRRVIVCALLIISVALLSAPIAGAERPTREFLPGEDFVIEGSCAFDVGVTFLANKEYGTTFVGGAFGGATLVTGALKQQLTNLSDPSKSMTLNVPGPGLLSFGEDSLHITGVGPWLIFYPGVLVYLTGHFTLTASEAGVSVEQQGGTRTDLCAALA